MPLRYDEGMANAFKRLEEEIDKFNKCLQDLRLSGPRDDKTRIEDTKGGLLEGSYHWILETSGVPLVKGRSNVVVVYCDISQYWRVLMVDGKL
ncbi:hypothetical protein BJ878DRAFT_513446 [Calycina marina]|uniref:Uncharacterized protein n=1 Tax=Calycina marina TaxID=1763456 RepID=A0A9P8CDB2_9HELO|nr:hypothetical protein BJ878DRAFT_513446 [Calycina marina]